MTFPGYSDWKRNDFAAGDVVANFFGVATDGQNLYQGPCHHWSNIIVHCKPNGVDAYGIRVIFWMDRNFTRFYNQRYINLGLQAEYSVRVPVQAPFVWVQVVRTTTGTFLNPVSIFAFGTTRSGSSYELNRGESFAMVAANPAFGAGATQTFTPNWLVPGNSLLQVIPATAAGVNVALQYLDAFTPATLTYAQWWGATRAAPVNQQVPVIASDTTLIVANPGAAQNIQIFWTPMAT